MCTCASKRAVRIVCAVWGTEGEGAIERYGEGERETERDDARLWGDQARRCTNLSNVRAESARESVQVIGHV